MLPDDSSGTLRIRASAQLQLFAFDLASGIDRAQELRVELRIGDALGWLASTPGAGAVGAVGRADAAAGRPLARRGARGVAQEARVFGQSEALALGNLGHDAVPVLPEARVLLSAAVQRLTADLGSVRSLALSNFRLPGLTGANGGVVGDAVDQLHDPAGLVRQRLATAGPQLAAALNALLGPRGASVDLATRTVRVQDGGQQRRALRLERRRERLPAGLAGERWSFARWRAAHGGGACSRGLALNPFAVALHLHQSSTRTVIAPLWPAPDGQALARMLAQAAPSLAAHVALELMRRADEARPLIDAVLDAPGMLSGVASDAERALRPLAGSPPTPSPGCAARGSVAANPIKIQALFDALRPPDGPGWCRRLARHRHRRDPRGERRRQWCAAGHADLTFCGPHRAAAVPAWRAASVRVSRSLRRCAWRRAFQAHRAGRRGVRPAGGAHAHRARASSCSCDRPAAPTFRWCPRGSGRAVAAAEAALPCPSCSTSWLELSCTPRPGAHRGRRAGAAQRKPYKAFSADALRAWAANPVGVLTAAVPSITATGLNVLAPLLDDFPPAGVSASGTVNELSVTVAGVALSQPAASRVAIAAPSIAVPGIETLGLAFAISAAGLDELSVALGPARTMPAARCCGLLVLRGLRELVGGA